MFKSITAGNCFMEAHAVRLTLITITMKQDHENIKKHILHPIKWGYESCNLVWQYLKQQELQPANFCFINIVELEYSYVIIIYFF